MERTISHLPSVPPALQNLKNNEKSKTIYSKLWQMLHWLWLPKLDRKIHQRFPELVFQQWISWVVSMYFKFLRFEMSDVTQLTTFPKKCQKTSLFTQNVLSFMVILIQN